MNKIVEFRGKKYQAVEPTHTNDGKKTDYCGTCAFRTLNWSKDDFIGESKSTIDFQLKNNPWCYFNGQSLDNKAYRNDLDCRIHGKLIHWKEIE